MWNKILKPGITPYGNCHTCRELVRYPRTKCPNCGIDLDWAEMLPSLITNFSITQACSSANTIETLDLGVFIFLGTTAIRHFSGYPFWVNILYSLFWLIAPITIIRWYFKHGRWVSTDQDYLDARQHMYRSFKWWMAAHAFNALVIAYEYMTK